ncbi:hypothetical protein OEA41_003692 [Lepraria neglecta]|uniref:Uncharacterized protein n=1 Tax=Lepraria neglecta TaxID=209136 RepID=A0AAD9Z8V5_9LECA|nr:hypothetical protein OEA41_003692 [Lepraria neglecta]
MPDAYIVTADKGEIFMILAPWQPQAVYCADYTATDAREDGAHDLRKPQKSSQKKGKTSRRQRKIRKEKGSLSEGSEDEVPVLRRGAQEPDEDDDSNEIV